MTLEQRVAVLEEIFLKLQDYYMSTYSGEEIDALLASAGVPIGITKEYDSVSAMNSDFSGTDVTRGQFVLILPSDTSSEDYGKVYIKSTSNWAYVFTLTALTAIKGPQGPAGANGETGATGQPGKNFAVLGYHETLSALNAAVPSPEAGDTYGIGTEPPYAYYMYDPTISNWRYVGNLQGPAGSQGEKGDKGDTGATGPQGPEGPVGGASNFVRYDAAQTLTDSQKQQARENINAAPDGFGYGGALDTVSGATDEAFLAAVESKLTTMPPTGAMQINWGSYPALDGLSRVGTLVKHGDQYASLTGYSYGGIAITRCKNAGTWGPWEWVNPLLALGVEYRTTERYLGKPVYCRLIDFGSLPNATTKMVYFNNNSSIIISAVGITSYNVLLLGTGENEHAATLKVRNNTITIKTTGNQTSYTATILVKYYKGTD